jgi:hypothetical protein
MERRRYLCGLGAGAAMLVAGCGGVEDFTTPAVNQTTVENRTATTVGNVEERSRIAWGRGRDWNNAVQKRGIVVEQGTLRVETAREAFDGGALESWEQVSGDWRERDGVVTNLTGGTGDTLARAATNAYGRWEITHSHGTAQRGGAFVLAVPDGVGEPGVPDGAYVLTFGGPGDDYRRRLVRTSGGNEVTLLDLGTYDDGTHTYLIKRNHDNIFTAAVDGREFGQTRDATVTSSGGMAFVAGGAGQQLQSVTQFDPAASLRSGAKSFGQRVTPNLGGLRYEGNGGRVELDLVGSPGTDREETVGLELDGSRAYDLSAAWTLSHRRFRVVVRLLAADAEQRPTLSRVALVGNE